MSGDKLWIVLVHTEPENVERFCRQLSAGSDRPLSVTLAATGEEGIRASLPASGATPDCVVVDLELPDMNAVEFASRLKDLEGYMRVPLVVVIDSAEQCQAASAVLRSGAHEYIARSWMTPEVLVCALDLASERLKIESRLRSKRVALERWNRQFRVIVENVPEIITQFDREYRHLYVNPAIEGATGFAPENFIGSTTRETGVRAGLCDEIESSLRKVFENRNVETCEFWNDSPQGKRWYLARLVPEISERGGVESVLGICTDVTDAKREGERLRQSERRLRGMIDCLPSMIAVLTPEGVLIELNRTAIDAAFPRPEEVLGKPFAEVRWWSHSPESREQFRAALERARQGLTTRYDVEVRLGEGEPLTIDFMLAPFFDERQQLTHLIASAWDITERQHNERAMRVLAAREQARAAELRAVLRATPAAIWVAEDRECRKIMGNPAAHRLIEADEKVHGEMEVYAASEGARKYQEYRGKVPVPLKDLPLRIAAADGVEVNGTELTLRFNDGTEKYIYGNSSPLRDPEGEIYGAVAAFIDITNLKKAEEAARVLEEQFRLASETVSGVIYDWEARTGRVDRSSAVEKLTGYRLEEVEPTMEWWEQIIHPDDLAELSKEFETSVAAGVPLREVEYRLIHRDGSIRHVWDRSRLVYNPQGALVRVIGYTIDITERVKNEERLRQQERKLRKFAASDIIGIVISRTTGELSYVNDEFLRIIGYEREDVEAHRVNWLELTPEEWASADAKGIEEARKHGSCVPYEKEYIRKNGERIPVLIGYTQSTDSPDEFIAFILDVTERKRAEKVLKDADRRKDEFIAMLAHELRNPLAAIRTAAHVLRLKSPDDPDLNWGQDVIERQLKHLTRLIEDLLDVSRIATGKIKLKRRLMDVREVVSRASESVASLMESKRQELRVSLPSEPLIALADAARLEQVLSNLLTNAAKFTDSGGTITVIAHLDSEMVELRVHDNGVGISPDMLPSIFGLFTQVDNDLDRSQGGLGIGLTLVKSLVEMHAGSVGVTSEGIGKGAEFWVRIPARDPVNSTRPPLADAKVVGTRLTPVSGNGSRVLVVEDNVDIATGLARLISSSGHEVRVAHDGPTALDVARDFHPDYALMDIGLPGMNGYELAETFRGDMELRHTTLIALSGYSQVRDRERTHSSGFDHHLLKPADASILLPLLVDRRSREVPRDR